MDIVQPDENILKEVTGFAVIGAEYNGEEGVYANIVRIGTQIVGIGNGGGDPTHLANLLVAGKKYRVLITEMKK